MLFHLSFVSKALWFLPIGGTGKIWLKEKDERLIIPVGLRERDFKLMPSREVKKPGPVFGTNAGKDDHLSVRALRKETLFHIVSIHPNMLLTGLIRELFGKSTKML